MNCPHCGRDANQPALLLTGRPKRGQLMSSIRRLFRNCGPQGLTAEDVERLTRAGHASVSARVHDLARRGEITHVGLRETESGRRAWVYVLKPPAEGFER
jgi:hypothetical protein